MNWRQYTITIKEILKDREELETIRISLLKDIKLVSLVQLSLNMPGINKNNKMSKILFDKAITSLLGNLIYNKVKFKITPIVKSNIGPIFSIKVYNLTPSILKELCLYIEQKNMLSAYWDIDVYDKANKKIPRSLPRKCFLCNNPAKVCAFKQTHSYQELNDKIKNDILKYFFSYRFYFNHISFNMIEDVIAFHQNKNHMFFKLWIDCLKRL